MESIRTNLSMPLALSLERLNALIFPTLLSEWNDLRIESLSQHKVFSFRQSLRVRDVTIRRSRI